MVLAFVFQNTLGGLREIDVRDATKGGSLILFLFAFFACTTSPSSGLGISNRGCQLEDTESLPFFQKGLTFENLTF